MSGEQEAEAPRRRGRSAVSENSAVADRALSADERPYDHTPITTTALPPTPTRDRNIAASAWTEAPHRLLELGDDLDLPEDRSEAAFKRRLGNWLLWRAGPAKGPARYLAIRADDLSIQCEFTLFFAREGEGHSPTGETVTRFRDWKQSLLI
jgi:hypothetical protein